MIVTPMDGRLLVVTQNDHAHFAGELLALWRSDGLPDHPRRQTLLFAAREHDNGWAEIDSAPMYHPASGRPLDFMTVSRDTRWDVWRRSTRRYADRDPYAALLIVRHAIHLHRSQLRNPEWADIVTEWHELEAELTAATGADEAEIARDYRWIELTDLLSLAVCNRWERELESHGFHGAFVGRPPRGRPDETTGIHVAGTLLLNPFPLAGATTFRIGCRLIPDRRYAGDADLGTELAVARWRDYAVRVAPIEALG